MFTQRFIIIESLTKIVERAIMMRFRKNIEVKMKTDGFWRFKFRTNVLNFA